MSASPNYASKPKPQSSAQLVTGDTNRAAPTSYITVVSGVPAQGTLVDGFTLQAEGDTPNTIVRVYTYDGSVMRLYDEWKVKANVASATNPAWSDTRNSANYGKKWPKDLPQGWELRMSINDTPAAPINVHAHAATYETPA